MRHVLLAVLVAVGAGLALAASSAALPGDPPVTALSPEDGATVPANAAGIAVAFGCPEYTKDQYGSEEEPIRDRGDASDYEVRFSRSADVGPDGRLADQPFGSDAGARPTGDGSTCTALLDTQDSASSPETAGGRVFWQASRSCVGCTPQVEVGPVRSFVVRPAAVAGTLAVPRRPYAGYLQVLELRTQADLSGAQVVLERRAGSGWRKVAESAFFLGSTELVGSLPGGRQRLRVVAVTPASRVVVDERTVTVRRGGRRATSRRDDGTYAARSADERDKASLSFRVSGAGTVLRGFRASLTTFCVGPSLESNRLFVATAVVGRVRVAPDGGVVGLVRAGGGSRVLLTGRLRGGRFRGEVAGRYSTCSGTRKLDAARR